VVNLADEEVRGSIPVVDNDQLRSLVEADPRQTAREMAQDLDADSTTISRHLSQIGEVKKFDKGVPREANEYRTNRRYEMCSVLKRTVSRSICDVQ
jgi:predicted transcriptional regulator